ncbi:hypothetical protein BD560DRAFT_380020 [Blakeslea trispora]|nr:hypothetical protein BD560DRAFT_380020 [Blakeslea trispora]
MRFSTLIFIAFSALSVHAAKSATKSTATAEKKLDIHEAVGKCTDNMRLAAGELRSVRLEVDGFSSERGQEGATLIGEKIENLEKVIGKVAKSCCAAGGSKKQAVLANEHIDAILQSLSILTPEVIATLSSITGKQAQLDQLPMLKPLLATDVQKLYKNIDKLNVCVLQSAPAIRHAMASQLTNQMNGGFLNVMAAFSPHLMI